MVDGAVQLRKGILLRMSVSHWLSFFHDMLSPQMVLLSGSLPMATLVVRGFSPRCMNVPPTWKSLVKSY